MAWWLWAIIGFGSFFAELMFPAFILIWMGIAAFFVMGAVLVFDGFDPVAQIFTWTLLSVLFIGLWWRFFKKNGHKILLGRSSANVVGEEGLIVEPVAPFQKGKVRFQKPILGADLWTCMAAAALAVGTRVRVTSVEGSLVTVEKTEKE